LSAAPLAARKKKLVREEEDQWEDRFRVEP
jgi:hypothetical protein